MHLRRIDACVIPKTLWVACILMKIRLNLASLTITCAKDRRNLVLQIFSCVVTTVLQYNATDIAFCALFLLYWETTTCMEHQILSQTTFSNNYGKPATSDLLITYSLKT
jgi:hypothetical protein